MSEAPPLWVSEVVPKHVSRIPVYVPGKPLAELEREMGSLSAVKMASNENPLGPSPKAIDALTKSLDKLNVYPESSGPVLRKALGQKWRIDDNSFILGNGSDEIMQMVAHVFIRPGDDAVIPENSFSMYRIVVESFGGRAIQAPLRNYRIDLEVMADAVSDNTRIIFLAFPNNPTGTIVAGKEFRHFLLRLADKRLVVVLDEAYAEFVRDPDCPRGIDHIFGAPPVLVLRTFSKVYGLAGLRIGYGIGLPWLIELLNRVRPPFNANLAAQVAAVAALDDIDHLSGTLDMVWDGLDYLSRELNSLGFEVINSQANFVSFRMKMNAGSVYSALLREGVIVRHLASFGMPDCIRVTVGTEKHNRRFLEALKRVIAEL
jgi:histidinol-phosphate aminotransferase